MKTSEHCCIFLWIGLFAITSLAGCERNELEHLCTPVENGQLVISEIRGPQSEVDTYGQWIELHNRGTTSLNLAGIQLVMFDIMGGGEKVIMVRDEGLVVAPGGYVVLGHQERGPMPPLPDHVDYGYNEDFSSDLESSGVLQLHVCNELVDEVIYQNLPTVGSLAFDGDLELTVDVNDDADPNNVESNWCNDASPVTNPTEVGTPGTPGEQNRPCN